MQRKKGYRRKCAKRRKVGVVNLPWKRIADEEDEVKEALSWPRLMSRST